MWEKIKSNRAAKFIVGLALVVVGVNWLMTDSLFFAVRDSVQPEDGKLSAGADALLMTVLQVFAGVMVSIGGYVMGAAEWLFKTVKGAVSDQSEPVSVTAAVPGQVQLTSTEPASDMKQLVIDLGRAAFENDQARLESLRWQIRMPQAIAELSDAYKKGDLETIASRQLELDGQLTKPAGKGGGANAK